MVDLHPMPGYSVVKLIDDQVTESGIIVQHDTIGMTNIAEMVTVGEDPDGYLTQASGELKAGDKVIIMPGRGETVPVNGVKYILMENHFILSAYEE